MTLKGALYGFVVSLVFLGIGLIRAVIAIASGKHMNPLTAQDARLLLFYVGGFTAAGALVGTLAPLLRTKFSIYLGASLAGIVVMFAIAVGDKGSLSALDGFDYVAMPLLGVLFGCAGAYGWTRD